MTLNRQKSLINILLYLILYLIGGSLITYLVIYFVSLSTNYSYTDLLNQLNSSTYTDLELFAKANFAGALSNFLSYLVLFVGLVIYNYKELKEEFKKITNKVSSFFIIAICGFIILYGVSYIISYLYDYFEIGSSNNQETIINYIEHGNAILTFIAVVILAPLVEEVVYRFSIFGLVNNRVAAYIISILLFALPHMLSTSASVGTWLLLAIPYILSGFMLALIYDSSKNIYCSTLAHMLNNLLSFVIILL